MTAVQHSATLRDYSDVEYVFEAHSTIDRRLASTSATCGPGASS